MGDDDASDDMASFAWDTIGNDQAATSSCNKARARAASWNAKPLPYRLPRKVRRIRTHTNGLIRLRS